MPSFLRRINKAKWYPHAGVPWLRPSDLQADALADLYTKDNRLSVWYVDDQVNVDDIVTALAATRDAPTNFDYVLVDERTITILDIAIRPSPFDTPDARVNSLHRDFVELTDFKLRSLAGVIALRKPTRMAPSDVKSRLKHGVSTGVLDRAKIPAVLLERLA